MQRFDKKLAKLFDWEWVYTFQMTGLNVQQRRKQILSCGIMVTYFKKNFWILSIFFLKVALV